MKNEMDRTSNRLDSVSKFGFGEYASIIKGDEDLGVVVLRLDVLSALTR